MVEEAETQLREGIQHNKRDPELNLFYAQFLSKTGRPKQADKHFKISLKSNPDNPRAHFSYGIHLSSHGLKEKAREHLEMAASIDGQYESLIEQILSL